MVPTLFCILLSVACAPASKAVLARTPQPTPTVTATATPTVSPSPTPTLVPTPTPMPELTYEQKKSLLGIDKDLTSHVAGALYCFNVSFSNLSGRIWCISYGAGSGKHDVYSVCNNEYLFSLQLPQSGATGVFEFSKYLSESNANLENLVLENSTNIVDMATDYDVWNFDYNNNQFLRDLSKKIKTDPTGVLNTPLSEEQIVDLIINSTPQDEIIPFWVYTPGAQIPEELKGIYSEEEYPPAPAE